MAGPTRPAGPDGSTSAFNPFHTAQRQLDMAAERLGLDHGTWEALRWPRREFKSAIPVRMDSGDIQVFHAYRVQYNDARGPTKGGLRFHPEETIDTVRALAAWMTWKTSIVDIPLGGAKGGITCDPKQLSPREMERLSRAYIREFWRVIGAWQDVPAPDVYTNPQVMAWMMDEYETIRGHSAPGMITGKPLELGGSQGRHDATARGGVFTVREAGKALGFALEGGSAAIQGFGNAGQYAALLTAEILGMKVVAVSDSRSGIYDPNGLDPAAIVAAKLEDGTLEGMKGADTITNAELLELDVDVLYPSAMENVITSQNADAVKAKIICELANGPTSLEADDILFDKGSFVIPDFLANAGGVTVSYFEQVQNASNLYWKLEDVHDRLDVIMTDAFHAAHTRAAAEKTHLRMGAYMVAASRVAEAMQLRGRV